MATHVEYTTGSPRVEMLPALRRHWLIALVPVILFVAGAVALGLKRAPEYKATTNLSVGHVYVPNPGAIPTVIEATQSLAAVYSRAIRASAVVAATRRSLSASGGRVTGSVSATAIPQTPLIKVTAKSASSRDAVALANASAAALAAYVNRQVRDNGASTLLAQRYKDAALAYRRRVDRSDRLVRRYERSPTAANRAARDRAAAATDTAFLERAAVSASYQNAVEGGTASVAVDIFSRAGRATSDRWQAMQILLFVGLLGGVAAGMALALLRAGMSAPRRRYR
jgi:hypothetical protein